MNQKLLTQFESLIKVSEKAGWDWWGMHYKDWQYMLLEDETGIFISFTHKIRSLENALDHFVDIDKLIFCHKWLQIVFGLELRHARSKYTVVYNDELPKDMTPLYNLIYLETTEQRLQYILDNTVLEYEK